MTRTRGHGTRDARRRARLDAARRRETAAPLTITRHGDAVIWRGDGYYAETASGYYAPSHRGRRGALLLTASDILAL